MQDAAQMFELLKKATQKKFPDVQIENNSVIKEYFGRKNSKTPPSIRLTANAQYADYEIQAHIPGEVLYYVENDLKDTIITFIHADKAIKKLLKSVEKTEHELQSLGFNK